MVIFKGHQVMFVTDNTIVVSYINKQGGTHFLYQQTGRNPFPYLVTSSCGSFSLAPISGHHPQGQALSRLPERDSRPPVSAKSAYNDRVESPSRNCKPNLQDMGNSNSGHVCHSPQYPSSPVYISDSGVTSTDDRCSDTRLAGMVDVHVPTISCVLQSHSETMCHPG